MRTSIDVYLQEVAARSYALVGETDRALGLLEVVLAKSGTAPPAQLALDPVWRNLAGVGRFQMLVRGAGRDR
jgi:hypothetical protein